ncbi:MAG: hypothetical protein ACQESD_04025 [Thermoplasmatota archaeon]
MADKEFQLNDLINALEHEKRSESLVKMDKHFFSELREYLDELEEDLKGQDFSTDRRAEILRREYSKAKKMAQNLFNTRVRKITLSAVHHSSGVDKVETEKMLDREMEFFKDTSMLITELKEEMFYGEYKRTPKESGEESVADELKDPKERLKDATQTEPKKDPIEDVSGVEEEQHVEPAGSEQPEGVKIGSVESVGSVDDEEFPDEGADDADIEEELEGLSGEEVEDKKAEVGEGSEDAQIHEILVHITEDVPPFVDIHTSYELKKEDVVTLREDIANVLITRGKARKIKLG